MVKQNEKDPLFTIKYNVSIDDYITFNKLLLGDFINNKSKKSYFVGGLLIATSILLGIQTIIFNRYDQYLLDFLIIFVFFMGIYDIIFYMKIFPSKLRKNALKMYKTTRFFNGDIILKFFDDYIIETSNNGDVNISWSSLEKLEENNKLIVLSFDNKHIVVINKNVVNQNLEDFIRSKCVNN